MSSLGKNLSEVPLEVFKDSKTYKIGIVVSSWNNTITDGLLQGTISYLKKADIDETQITIANVPGSFELPLGAQFLLESEIKPDGVICLGSVIRGETAHFDFVCNTCALGIKDTSLKYNKPVVFGVLTDDNIEQSIARSGGKLGNKGTEAAYTLLKMIQLKKSFP